MSSEQLSYELYKWLSPIQVLPSNLHYKSNGNFELDTKSSDGLMNGFLISKLLMKLANDHGATINQPLLSSIKQSNTPAARVYNWNILAESFTKLNVNVSKETQKEITSGKFSTLTRFLLDLHKKFNPKKAEKKQEDTAQQLNLKKLQILQNISEAETFLQMVIMIISKNFSLTPKQTVSTLSQNAKYYAHMVVKGIKNSFGQVLSMIDMFIKQMPNLMYLCQKSPEKNTEFFLDLIKPTLISRQPDVAKKGAQLFKVFLDESLKYNSKNLIYQILCRQSIGFDFLYMALKRHPDLAIEFTSFIFPLVRQALKDFFQVHLKRTINNEQEYLKILMKLLEGLTSSPDSKIKLKQSGLIDIWLKNSQESFNNTKNKEQSLINEQTKLLYLELLCNLWKQYATQINQEQAEELLMKGIEELKKNTRKQIYTIKIPALLRLFDFLHFLADCKNKVASILYKKLIFLFIENHQEEEIRDLILSNFKIMLKKYPTIPIDFLLDPLLKQLINSQGKTYILNIYDFQFLIEICKHPRMDADFGLSYLEYLSKLYIKSFIYAKLVIRIIQILTNRFCQQETIIQFLKKNVESTLNLYGILIFNKKKMSKQNAIMNKQKKSLAIELIKHYIQLQHQQLNMFILQKISALYSNWIDEKRYTDKGLNYLINLFGDVDQIVLQSKIKQNQRRFQGPPESEDTIQITHNDNSISKPTPKSQSYKEIQYMKEQGIGYKPNRVSKTRMEDPLQKSMAKPNPKVLKDIETLKQKLKQQANRKLDQQNNQRKKINQQNNLNSIQLLQRNLSLGYAKLSPLQQDKIIFDFDSVKPKQLKMTIKFHSLSQLQLQDEKSTEVILKQYTKQIKSLFLKYALISATSQTRRDQSNSLMSFTQVIKMTKQKNITNINKLVISDLITSINYTKRKQKNILSGIEQSQFNEFLIKLTDYVIQEERNAVELPFGLKLEQILKKLFHGEVFYQNKFRIKQPQNIIKLREQINKGQEDEDTQIPQGFKKIKENHVDLLYKLSSDEWMIPSRFQIGYDIADWLIHRCLGFHIISPSVEINQRYTLIQIPKPIKPKITKQETDPKIKYQPKQLNEADNQFSSLPDPQAQNAKKVKKPALPNQRRSLSHRALANKAKTDTIEQEEEKEKIQKEKKTKQLKYAEKLRQNLEKLRQQKNTKQQIERAKEIQQKQKEKKKQQERKKYIQSNRQKIKQLKMKEQDEKKLRQQQQKQQKERQKIDLKKKQHQLLQRQKDMIKQKAQKLNQKRKQLQNSREKRAQVHPKKQKQKQKQKQKEV